jgi:hypothetical protein
MCARIQIPWYVADRRIKVVPRYALGFHLDATPGSGVLLLGFGAWSIACDKLQAAPNALKVMCAKNFSTQANFGIMSEVSKND